MNSRPFGPLLALALLTLLTGSLLACGQQSDYYLHDGLENKDTVAELLALYDDASDAERFAIIREVADVYLADQDYDRAICFLTDMIERDDDFVYNTYFMLQIAWIYSQKEDFPIASLYLDRILKNHADLQVNGQSIHYSSLRQLIQLVTQPARRIEYRQELIERFPELINLGTEQFLLGKDYESIGEWDAAMDCYRQFSFNFSEDVPGYPVAIQYARNLTALSTTRKDWTYETLEELLDIIRQALATRNTYLLGQLRSKVGFFAMDWHQDKNDGNSQVLFDFAAFIDGDRVYYESTLDPASSAQEAFLRTWGWTERIAVWYLYFRKIDFPADPEFHGRWEWAGIYFGEKLP